MRLLIINDHGIKGGGTENRLRLLLEEFLRTGAFKEIHMIQSADVERCTMDGVEFHYSSKGYFSSYRLAKKIIRDKGIEIVQAHNMQRLFPFPILAAKKAKIPVVWFAHDYWTICGMRSFVNPYLAGRNDLCNGSNFKECLKCIGLRGILRLKLFRRIIEKADVGISASKFMVDLFEDHNVLKGRWIVLNPWINLKEFYPDNGSRNRKDLLFVGSLVDYKGAWVVAQAMKYLKEDYPDIKIKFIFESENGIEKIKNIGLKDGTLDNMVFMGQKSWSELNCIFNDSAVLVFPTVCMESFGLVWAEAMAAGLPVVASRVGSVPEFIGDKAVLAEPKSSEDFASSIKRLMEDKALVNRISGEGLEFARKKFDVSVAAGKLVEVYSRVIEQERR